MSAIHLSESKALFVDRGAALRPLVVNYMRQAARAPLTEEEHYQQADMQERCYTICSRIFNQEDSIFNQVVSNRCLTYLGCAAFLACPITLGSIYGPVACYQCFVVQFGCVVGYAFGSDVSDREGKNYIEKARDNRNKNLTIPRITRVIHAAEEIRNRVRDHRLEHPFTIVAQFLEGGERAILELIARGDPLPTVDEIMRV